MVNRKTAEIETAEIEECLYPYFKKCLNLGKLQNRKEISKKLTLCNVVVSDHDDIITISETECRNIRHLHINLPATTTKGKLRLRILEY